MTTVRRTIKNVVKNYSPAEVKVREATSNDAWGPSTTQMLEVAEATYNPISFIQVMNMIWKRLNDHGKNWRHVYKSLVLLEYLLRHGSDRVAEACRENLYHIQTLKDFQYVEENKDLGHSVREKSKQLVAILRDTDRLNDERLKAAEARRRLFPSGVSSSYHSSSSRYGSGGGGEYGLRERDMPSSSYNLRGGDDRFYGDRENRPRERYDGGGYGAARAVERRTSGGLGGASSRRKSLSDVENPRPTPRDTNDEDMQLQIALQISREEAEKDDRRKREEDAKLQMAIEASRQTAALEGIPVENNGRGESRLQGPPSNARRGGPPAASSSGGANTDTLLDLSEAFSIASPPSYADTWNAPSAAKTPTSTYDPFVVSTSIDPANNPFAADAAAAAAASSSGAGGSGGRWETFGAAAGGGTGAATASAAALAAGDNGGSFDILSYRNTERLSSGRTSILRGSGAGGGAALSEWGGSTGASTTPKDPFAMGALGLQLAEPSGAAADAPFGGRAQSQLGGGSLSRGKSGSTPNLFAGGGLDIFESNTDSVIGADADPFASFAAGAPKKAPASNTSQFLNDDASRLVNLDNLVTRAPAGTGVSNPFLRSPAQQFTSPASKTTLNELAGSNKPLGMMAPPAQPQQPPLGGASFGGLPAPLIPPPAAPQPAVSLYPNVAATTSFGQPPYGAMYGAGAFSSGYAAPMQQPFPQQLQPFPYQPRQAF